MANDRHSVGSCKNLDLQTFAESRWLSTRCQAPRRSAELSIDSRMKLDALVGTLCATAVCRQRASLTESQNSTCVFAYLSGRKMWYLGLSFSGSGDRNGRRVECGE